MQVDTQNPANLIVVLNGDLSRFPLAPIKRIEYNALGGGDTLGVNNSGGPVTVPGGIIFNGGSGTDSFVAAGGSVKATQDLYFATIGSSQTTSQITYDDGSRLTTTFNDVEKVADDVESDQLIVTATNAQNNMILDDGAGTGDGRLRVQITDVKDTTVYPPIEFSQKAQVVLNADASVVLFGADDNISLSNTERAFGMTQLVVNGLLGDDQILVSDVSVPTTVRGGDGQDTITVGKPTFLINPVTGVPIFAGDTLTSNDAGITVLGDGGVFTDKDTLDIVATSPTGGALSGEVNNHAVTGFGTQSSGISYSGIDALSLSLNALDDSVFIRSTVAGIPTTIDAGGGADLIRFGSQGGFNMPAFGTVGAVDGAVTVSGGGGDDTLVFDDSGDTSNASVTVTSNQITGLGTAGVTYNGIDAISIFLGSANDTATIKSLAQGVDCTVSGLAGNDEVDFDFHTLGFGSSLTVNGGPNGSAGDTLKFVSAFKSDVLTVTQDQVTLAGNTAVVHYSNVENIDTDAATAITNGMSMANSFHTSGGVIVFSTSQHLTGLTIAGGLVALSGTGNTIFTPTLSITNGGRLELGGNTLELDYGTAADPAAQIRSLLLMGTGGTAGITSAAATGKFSLGFTDSADAGTLGTLVVRRALVGDTNVDGKVDFTDLLSLAQNFGKSGKNWDQGDFDYDGKVAFGDLLRLAQNYNASAAQPGQERRRLTSSRGSRLLPDAGDDDRAIGRGHDRRRAYTSSRAGCI